MFSLCSCAQELLERAIADDAGRNCAGILLQFNLTGNYVMVPGIFTSDS